MQNSGVGVEHLIGNEVLRGKVEHHLDVDGRHKSATRSRTQTYDRAINVEWRFPAREAIAVCF